MIGVFLLCAASLLYGAAYAVHSVRQRNVPAALLDGGLCLLLFLAAALWGLSLL